jgi:GDPmannose 4,6-dehydratase
VTNESPTAGVRGARRKALITGITGQDGSYLAELLLAKGYDVHGLIRRASTFNTERLDSIYQDPHDADVRLRLHYGDLHDGVGLVNLLHEVQPDEVYHLGAQSHVKVSFEMPDYTGDVTALGTIRLLEAIRASGISTRFYQASSSEMFGSAPPPQNEQTPFHPRSPYGAAKVYAYWATVNYREAYNMFAVNGILFNHECVPAGTPVAIRQDGFIDILPIEDVVPHRTDPRSGTRYTSPGGDFDVWDGVGWSRCTARTATWHEEELVEIHGRGALFSATTDHVVFLDGGTSEGPAGSVAEGDRLWLADVPTAAFATVLTSEEASLLGFLTAEGWISEDGHQARITCGDVQLLSDGADAWQAVTAGFVTKETGSPSAFSEKRTPSIRLCGAGDYLRMLRREIYTRDGHKRVPKRILNAAPPLQEAFLRAYNRGDGLKKGGGTDEFKSFRTNSEVLAAGLIWLARTTLGRSVSIYKQPGALGGGSSFLINLSTGSPRGNKGAHLHRPKDEVRKVTKRPYRGWMFDLATESGRFACGPGLAVVHNSPRRGETFVTRKISRAVARIQAGMQDKLYLGNLDARRDWGYAPEYVDAMWRMLQADSADDFVVATGSSYSIREFVEFAFSHAGLDWEKYVEIDVSYKRPAEVDYLLGDASKAKDVLGWEAKVRTPELARLMVDADITLLADQLAGRTVRVDRG